MKFLSLGARVSVHACTNFNSKSHVHAHILSDFWTTDLKCSVASGITLLTVLFELLQTLSPCGSLASGTKYGGLTPATAPLDFHGSVDCSATPSPPQFHHL